MAKKQKKAKKKKTLKKSAPKKCVTAKKKKPSARRAKKAVALKGASPGAKQKVRLEKVGTVTHYFPRVKAAAVLVLKDGLKTGDSIYIKGHTSNFNQTVTSMQLDHVSIQAAHKGQEIGILVKSRTRIGDTVYKV